MTFLKSLHEATGHAIRNLRQSREEAEAKAAAAAAEAGELEAIVKRHDELARNVEAAKLRCAQCVQAFESYLADAQSKALDNLTVGWESGTWPTHLTDLARATAAEVNRDAILAAFRQRVALYEVQLADFLERHRPALDRLGVL